MTYPQPWEGVAGGFGRADDLLSLEPTAVSHRLVICDLARTIRHAILTGNAGRVVIEIRDRLLHPEIGDLVIETSRVIFRRVMDDDQVKGMGILVDHRTEWACTDDEWEQLGVLAQQPPFRPALEAWYVQYGPAATDIARWANADFMAVTTLPPKGGIEDVPPSPKRKKHRR